MTLLTICASAAPSIGITAPASIVGSLVQDAIEMLALAKTEVFELSQRNDWEGLIVETTFVSLGQEQQTGMIPTDFDRFISDTLWNRTAKRKFTGPMTAQQWQQIKAWSTSPVLDMFRVRGGQLLVQPPPTAGDTYAYEYVTNLRCLAANGVTTKLTWTLDSDTCRMDEKIVEYGLIWRFRKQKGMTYDAEFQTYEDAIKNASGSDIPKTILNFANPGAKFRRVPGIITPSINWPTS